MAGDRITTVEVGHDLAPYVPRVQLNWLATNPERRWRETDGTLVFADISGFTPLTERLAKRGRVGAEELTDVLNQVFSRLLEVAFSAGGDLLKFGGDALLLLFEGPGHAWRALNAANGMQREIRPFRRFRTAAGPVSLKMSVGVASGRVMLFLVGRSHRELLISGPVPTEAAELEARADADQVLASPVTLAQAATTAALPSPSFEPFVAASATGGPNAISPVAELAIPAGLRAHLAGGRETGEHRLAVLTFVQFKGVDDLLATEGPDTTAAALDELVSAMQDECERHGVCFLATDVDRNGGKIVLCAGAPTATPEDADRTLAAVLDVVRRSSPFQVRGGVNAGRAFAVDVGHPTRRTYAVMGDPTNLAARVMGKSQPGQLLATAAALRLTRARYELDPVEPFMVKGKSQPVHASVVEAVLDGRTRVSTWRVVGRAAEQAVLADAVTSSRAGVGSVVHLVAEPGMGKSALVTWMAAQAADLPHLAIEANEYGAATPYAAVRPALRRLLALDDDASTEVIGDALLAAAGPDAAPWLPLLALPLGVHLPESAETTELDPSFRVARLHEAMQGMLNRRLAGPALVTVEDSHWLDDASAELLRHLIADPPGWAVCITSRPGADRIVVPAQAIELQLEPMSTETVAKLAIEHTSDEPLPAHVVNDLAARSGGNPFFLQELIAAARAGDAIEGLPDTIEGLLASRIDTLPRDDRAVLRHAAVLGQVTEVDLLLDLLGGPADLDRLDGFLVRDGAAVRFSHALVRDAAYEGLPFRERRRLHGQAAQLLEARGGDADLLSLHWFAAQRFPEAWQSSLAAAQQARDGGSSVDAAVFLRRAVTAGGRIADLDPDALANAFEALGEVCELSGQYDQASDAYRRARRLMRDKPVAVATIFRKEGIVRERTSNYAEALRWYTRAKQILDQMPDCDDIRLLRASLDTSYGAGRMRQGRKRAAVPYLERALAAATEVNDRKAIAHASYLLASVYADLGDERADDVAAIAIPIYEELGDLAGAANAYNNLGVNAYYVGRWTDALGLYEKARDAMRRSGDVVQLGTAANNVGEILSDQGHLAEAEEQFEEALRVWKAARYPVGIALASSNLGRAALRAGRASEAIARLEEAADRFTAIGARGFVVETQIRMGEVAAAVGDTEATLDIVEQTTPVAVEQGEPVVLAALARLRGVAHAQSGDIETARQHLDTALATSLNTGADFEAALSHEALGRLHHLVDGGGLDHSAAADALFARLGVIQPFVLPLVPQRLVDLSVVAVGDPAAQRSSSL